MKPLPDEQWCDFAQLLEWADCAIPEPAREFFDAIPGDGEFLDVLNRGLYRAEYAALGVEMDRVRDVAIARFFKEAREKPEYVKAGRKLISNLVKWNNTTATPLWEGMLLLDDETFMRFLFPLFQYAWD